MNLSKLSVKKPVTVMMLTLIIIILGAVSLQRLPIDLLPNIEIPIIIVSTSYSGAGPQEVENLITRPIEGAIGTVSNIKNITSMSSEGNSVVIAEFDFGIDMDFTSLEMREKVDMVKGMLPEDAGDPMVIKIDPNAQAIVQLSLTSTMELSKLQAIAEDSIQPRFERLEGIASVSTTGGYTNQIEILVNEQKMRGYGLSLDYLSQILASENLNMPGGQVQNGNQKLTIKTVGEFKSVDEIRALPIPLQTGGVVTLSDIADVQLNYKDTTSIVKTNGRDSINISIQKQSGTNTVAVAESVTKELENLKKDFPNINFEVVMDQSEYIRFSIDNVANSAIQGGILAILILFLFLRNLRTTFIIGVSIPVSIIATFALLYFSKITLNMMTLGGLALGIGMLVDNSIVVLENIFRFREEGHSREDAAIEGTGEVSMAVVASTLTTIAVFIPIVFVEGMTAIIFKELALTITFSLVASLVIALTVVPMMASKLLKVDRNKNKERKGILKIFSFIYAGFDKFFNGMESVYKKILNWALNHRKSTVFIAIAVFIASMVSLSTVGSEFFPQSDQGQISISISMPDGAEIEDVAKLVSDIEGKIEGIQEIKSVFSRAGSGGGYLGGGSNSGSITVMLKSLSERERGSLEVADEIRNLVKDIPGAKIGVTAATGSMGMMGGSPISISIKGDDLEELKRISDDFENIIRSVEGTREPSSSLDREVPEVQIKIDRRAATQYGLTASQIASAVRGNITGRTATTLKYDGDELDVVIKSDNLYNESLSNLKQIIIQTASGASVTIGQVAEVTIEKGPITINRDNQVRVVTVSSQIMGRDLLSVTNDINQKLMEYNMPDGYIFEIGGESQQQQEAFADLGMALVLALIIVYMVIASQFESLLNPFIIMLSVPFSFSGGALALALTRRSLSVPAFIGVIMLAGIVVNNAIVLIDYIITRRKRGEDRRTAVINAGPIRLRPILMTTLTTILGLMPMALGIGEGAETMAPMGTVVIGGLTLSTLLTLVFIPVTYTLFDDLSVFLKTKLFKRKNTVAGDITAEM
ncbi:swarming motility protein SwrC [Oxobacter pfennigii]|uniref:Swarming motility protein SwrC n=1 Tax=Oxobacter pfennigii TaxID=36849 RepID=A0A0P8X2W5_9CLOT|nr:efflux RND transporter permease subunit [Oxobacter pfennigii]KPU45133.1 swarming motility protein SwrC [Oxobacter pfennigii]